MTVLEFIIYLVVAGVCGAIGRALGGGTRGGFVVSILLGFLGAFLGTWVARQFNLPALVLLTIGGHPFPLIWSIIGAVVLVGLAHALVPRRYVTVP